jgi:hypothetical protein
LLRPHSVALVFALFAPAALAQTASCTSQRDTIDIPGSTDPTTRACWRKIFVQAIQRPNTTVRLGPDVDFDFTDVKSSDLPFHLGHCVTLKSVAQFDTNQTPLSCSVLERALTAEKAGAGRSHDVESAGAAPGAPLFGPPHSDPPSARNSHALGPVLRYGKHPDRTGGAFIEATCPDDNDGDGARISGFRVFGPSFGNQTTDEIGLRVFGCTDVEISNMEVAGWGGAAIEIDNEAFTDIPDQEPDPILALVHDNYLHDNKQPTHGGTLGIGGHAGGYGVNTGQGGWARIFNNTLDNNRHDVTASGKAGGYEAEHNLILKGGGYHGAWYEKYIHVFDVHGTDHCDTPSSSAFNCGDAGRSFLFKENVFQYKKTTDIKIRGKPRGLATITGNVFARSDQDAAIDLQTPDNVKIVGNNQFNVDQFGAYDVCDFDGDGFDDLFLATDVSWWFSGQGRFPWTFLRADQSKRENLRFGYFDNDNRCDVLMELPSDSGQWFISSGGMTDPFATPLGNFGHPLNEVRFGRFDPTVRDHRIGVTLPTTHAFWRRADGQWFVTPLTHPEWKPVQSSSFPLSQLRFGSFTGDGETDVLAVENGHWSISKAGAGPWVTLNSTLSDPVENLYIANMDADDNVDDILRLDRKITVTLGNNEPEETVKLTWWRSKNGTEPWKVWKTYSFQYRQNDPEIVPVRFGFVGRFGRALGQGSSLVIDQNRMGSFHNGATRAVDWASLFPY